MTHESPNDAMLDASVPFVLVVDDDPSILDLYVHALAHLGCETKGFHSGADVLKYVHGRVPQLIILDYMMDGMDGVELLRELRQFGPTSSVPVILLTAAGDSDALVHEAFRIGATDFISKPVNLRVLSQRVKGLVDAATWKTVATNLHPIMDQHASMQDELVKATQVQAEMLPQAAMRIGPWQISGEVLASNQVGGDLFDIIETPYGLAVALIDVSGHGIAAGLFASNVRGMLRVLLQNLAFEDAVAELNRQLNLSGSSYYACVAIVGLTESEVLVANAGLPPVTLIYDDATTTEVLASGPPPGLVDAATYVTTRVPVQKVQRLVLMSDGLTEPFGVAHETARVLYKLHLLDPRISPPAALKAGMQKLLSSCQQDQEDDASLVVIDRAPRP